MAVTSSAIAIFICMPLESSQPEHFYFYFLKEGRGKRESKNLCNFKSLDICNTKQIFSFIICVLGPIPRYAKNPLKLFKKCENKNLIH